MSWRWAAAVLLAACQPTSTTTSTSTTVIEPSTTVAGPDYGPPPGAYNPAVTQATIGTTICVTGWTATIRPSSTYTTKLKLAQIAARRLPGGAADYEEDHYIPLGSGGSPINPANLWPEPRSGPHATVTGKDAAEVRLQRAVCAGTITLAEAQAEIRDPANWHAGT